MTNIESLRGKIITPQQAYDLIKSGWHGNLKDYKVSPNFNWGEVFTSCSRLEIFQCPRAYYNNALKQAQTMEKVRAIFGKPVTVTSWYRDKAHNEAVKGGSKSQHLLALATDFTVKGLESIEGNLTVQKKLDKLDFMQTCGMEWTGGFWTHVDSRGKKERFPIKK